MSSTVSLPEPAAPAAGPRLVLARANPFSTFRAGGGRWKNPYSFGPRSSGEDPCAASLTPPARQHLPPQVGWVSEHRHRGLSGSFRRLGGRSAISGTGYDVSSSPLPRATWGGGPGGSFAHGFKIPVCPCGLGLAQQPYALGVAVAEGAERGVVAALPRALPAPPPWGSGGVPGPSPLLPAPWRGAPRGAAGRSPSRLRMSPRAGPGGHCPGFALCGPGSG